MIRILFILPLFLHFACARNSFHKQKYTNFRHARISVPRANHPSRKVADRENFVVEDVRLEHKQMADTEDTGHTVFVFQIDVGASTVALEQDIEKDQVSTERLSFQPYQAYVEIPKDSTIVRPSKGVSKHHPAGMLSLTSAVLALVCFIVGIIIGLTMLFNGTLFELSRWVVVLSWLNLGFWVFSSLALIFLIIFIIHRVKYARWKKSQVKSVNG